MAALPNNGGPGTGGALNANAIDFAQVPGFTPLWSNGYGQAPFNTVPAAENQTQVDLAKAPGDDEPPAVADTSPDTLGNMAGQGFYPSLLSDED